MEVGWESGIAHPLRKLQQNLTLLSWQRDRLSPHSCVILFDLSVHPFYEGVTNSYLPMGENIMQQISTL